MKRTLATALWTKGIAINSRRVEEACHGLAGKEQKIIANDLLVTREHGI